MASPSTPTEPFPPAPEQLPSSSTAQQDATTRTSPVSPRRARASTAASIVSTASNRIQTLLEADIPPGFLAATGAAASKAPTLTDIRRGSFDSGGWNERAQRRSSASEGSGRRSHAKSSGSTQAPAVASPPVAGGRLDAFPPLTEEETTASPAPGYDGSAPEPKITTSQDTRKDHAATEVGEPVSQEPSWEQPPPLPWTTSFMLGLRAYLKWVITIPGFLITVYGLNIVAWGGMLFLLLCNASPAMCHPSCDDINSPRRVWIEIDSQILNALFCVTGFGLAPWRFRDLYWWAFWRLGRKPETKSTGIRRLAGIHRDWFRLPGSDTKTTELDPNSPAVPIPATKAPTVPLTGVRAPPTKSWKMDWVVWMNVWNTFLQAVLCGFMWGLNRYDRPSWSTGTFVALACIVAGLGGLMIFLDGKEVKKVEGVPIGPEERKARGWPVEDMETGVQEAVEKEIEAQESSEKKGLKKRFMETS